MNSNVIELKPYHEVIQHFKNCFPSTTLESMEKILDFGFELEVKFAKGEKGQLFQSLLDKFQGYIKGCLVQNQQQELNAPQSEFNRNSNQFEIMGGKQISLIEPIQKKQDNLLFFSLSSTQGTQYLSNALNVKNFTTSKHQLQERCDCKILQKFQEIQNDGVGCSELFKANFQLSKKPN